MEKEGRVGDSCVSQERGVNVALVSGERAVQRWGSAGALEKLSGGQLPWPPLAAVLGSPSVQQCSSGLVGLLQPVQHGR